MAYWSKNGQYQLQGPGDNVSYFTYTAAPVLYNFAKYGESPSAEFVQFNDAQGLYKYTNVYLTPENNKNVYDFSGEKIKNYQILDQSNLDKWYEWIDNKIDSTLTGSYKTTAKNNLKLAKSKINIEDSDYFTINSSSGLLQFKSNPDYEIPFDKNKDGIYYVGVYVESTQFNQGPLIQPLKIVVSDVKVEDSVKPVITSAEKKGTIAGGGYSFSFKENLSDLSLGTLNADEPVTWSLTGPDAMYFGIQSQSNSAALLKWLYSPDFETPKDNGGIKLNNIYEFNVKATDQSGNFEYKLINVLVNNVDEVPPEITATKGNKTGQDLILDIEENTSSVITKVEANETVKWEIGTSDDGSKFAINSSGEITFKNSPNFEIPVDSDKDNKYKFKVIATDTLENKTEQSFIVNVTDLEDGPKIEANGISSTGEKKLISGETTFEFDWSTNSSNLDIATFSAPGETLTWSKGPATNDDFKFVFEADSSSLKLSLKNGLSFTNSAFDENWIKFVSTDADSNKTAFNVIVNTTNTKVEEKSGGGNQGVGQQKDITAPIIEGNNGKKTWGTWTFLLIK